jgi:FkbM family methyltransferase
MSTYYYFQDKDYPVLLSQDTLEKTPVSFSNGIMWEEESIKYFYDCVPVDKKVNILDIGAQSGLYSLYAKFLPLATFYAFEPFIPTFDLLNENIQLNNITNIHTYNLGLSNKKENTVLNTSLSHNGLHTLGNPLRFSDVLDIEIEVDTIDNLFFDRDIPLDFIKIDTEGWEYFILKGGEKTIKKYKPMIQLEWVDINMKQCNVSEAMLNLYIDEIGYMKQNFTNEELIIIPKI